MSRKLKIRDETLGDSMVGKALDLQVDNLSLIPSIIYGSYIRAQGQE